MGNDVGNTRLNAFHVPELRQKLWALYLVSNLDDADLGALIGVTPRAIRHWITGEANRDPEHVPPDRFEQLVTIIHDRMPHPVAIEEVRALLFGPSYKPLMLALLFDKPAMDWMTLVMNAQPSAAEVLPERGKRWTVLDDPLDGIKGCCDIAVGQQFRLRLQIPYTGWLTIVQWGRSGWGGMQLESRDDGLGGKLYAAVLRLEEGDRMLPPSSPYMKETEPGVRRYILIHSKQPFPENLKATLLNSARSLAVLDADTLVRLAQFANGKDVDMKALDINFTG